MQRSLITEQQNEQMSSNTRYRRTTRVVQFQLLLIYKTKCWWENYIEVNRDEFTVHRRQ